MKRPTSPYRLWYVISRLATALSLTLADKEVIASVAT
jgi:hypothetical protein